MAMGRPKGMGLFPFTIGIAPVIWQLLFFYVPICVTLAVSMYMGGLVSYQQVLTGRYLYVIIKSILLASSVSVLALILGYPVAYCISLKAGRLKPFLLFLVIVPFWTNFLLHVYAWFFVLEKHGVLNTLLLRLGLIAQPLALLSNLGAIMVGMVYCYLPFMILPIYSSLERFDKRLLEASADLGATPVQTILRVVLPLSLPGILSGLLLVLVPAFGEFAIISSLGGDRFVFVGTLISEYMMGAGTKGVGAAFTVVSACCLMLFVYGLYRFVRTIVWRVQ